MLLPGYRNPAVPVTCVCRRNQDERVTAGTVSSVQSLPSSLTGVPVAVSAWLGQYRDAQRTGLCETAVGTVSFAGGRWGVALSGAGLPVEPDGCRLALAARLEEGGAVNVGAGLSVSFSAWSRDHYVLVPGFAYAGNRFESIPVAYSPRYPADHAGPQARLVLSDVPRLEIGEGRSAMDWKCGDASIPAVGVIDRHRAEGWLLLVETECTHGGEVGFSIEESNDRRRAHLHVSVPGVRPIRYRHMERRARSADCGATLRMGDELRLVVRIWSFPAEDVHALFARLFVVRNLAGCAEKPRGPTWSQASRWVEDHYNRDLWDETNGLYRTDSRPDSRNVYQTGWCGGLIAQYALSCLGRETSTWRRVRRHFANALSAGVAQPSGLLYGKFAPARGWEADFRFEEERRPWTRGWTLIRRQGDALWYLLRFFEACEHRGEPVPPGWDATVRRLAATLATIWTQSGQFGHFVDQTSGQIRVGNSASGALIPGALVAAARRYGEERWMQTAQEAAAGLVADFLDRGVTTGGPADAMQCPDSESAAALLESLVALWEATGGADWLARAEQAAWHLASWVMPYDYPFPPATLFGRLGLRTTGTVFANVQNKHAAPGICTHSGLGLIKLFRATGNRRYLQLAAEIAGSLTQFVSQPDRPLVAADGRPLPSGWINERVNTSDWDDNLGGIFFGPCWCEVSLLLTALEIPGVYGQVDTGLVVALDAVAAAWRGRGELLLTNPSAFEAEVTVLVETVADARSQRWGAAGAPRFRRERLAPGESMLLTGFLPP